MSFEFPVIELVDRYVIARVKHRRLHGANSAELEFYTQQMAKLNFSVHDQDLAELERVHDAIWELEDDFKKCRIDGTDLAEIGRRALAIRDLNNHRIQFKNQLAQRAGSNITEIKQYGKSDHH